jgi:hypothetical protein
VLGDLRLSIAEICEDAVDLAKVALVVPSPGVVEEICSAALRDVIGPSPFAADEPHLHFEARTLVLAKVRAACVAKNRSRKLDEALEF